MKTSRDIQLNIISKLSQNLPEGSWWLLGGWALETLTKIPEEHDDIDLGIFIDLLVEEPYKSLITDNPSIDIIPLCRYQSKIIANKKGDEINFPREGLETESRFLCGIKVFIASPELLYLSANCAPREKDIRDSKLLLSFIDSERLERIRKEFSLYPKKPSPTF